MSFKVVLHPEVLIFDLPSLSRLIQKRILSAIESRLTSEPVKYGKPLLASLKGYRRIRVGDYRIIYRIIQREVHVLIVGHRKEIYENVPARKGRA